MGHASVSVRRMCKSDLQLVFSWRNHPDIRRFMLTQHEITFAEHSAWFDCASCDDSFALLVIEENKQPIGCVIFSGVLKNSTADWSFYSAPLNPRGKGVFICSAALDFAFSELGVHKVFGKVIDFNHASVRMHKRLGFKQEGNLRKHCLINGNHYDILCFGILSNDWLAV